MIDQHLHSRYSYDSEEDIEKYLKLTEGSFVTTEHLDLNNPVTLQDDIPDFQQYFTEIKRLQLKYNKDIRAGVEIGYLENQKERILEILSPFTFDIYLLSVHQNGEFDYMEDKVLRYQREKIYEEYLERLIEAVQNYQFCNVLTHIDYGIRRFGSQNLALERFDDLFDQLIDELLCAKMSVELNTRSMYQYKNIRIYEYFIKKYMKNGGSDFTLGSDGHRIAYYKYHFDDAILFLKNLGIKKINAFKQNKKIKITL